VIVSNLISDVASLWALALVATILILGLVFRAPLRTRIARGGVKAQWGDRKVELQTIEESISTSDAAPEDQTAPSAVEPEAIELRTAVEEDSAPVEEGQSPKATWGHVVSLLGDGQIEEATQAFSEMQATFENDGDRLQATLAFAYFRHRWGNDPSGQAELETFAKDPKTRGAALRLLGQIEEEQGYYDRALAVYEEALVSADDDYVRASAVIGISDSLAKLGRRDEAINRLMVAVASAETDEVRQKYYDQLAKLYEQIHDWLLRALALEKSLETSPQSASRRFNTGYAYAQAGEVELALLHYLATLEINPDHHIAQNNIGVAYEHLEMPVKAVRSYKRSAKGGETLAMANLANRFLNAGFSDEAREVLKPSMAEIKPHQNVGSVLARLARVDENEGAQEDKVTDAARIKQRFFRDFAAAFYVAAPLPDLAGRWVSSTGATVEITQEERSIIASFTVGEKRAQYVAQLTNAAITFDYLIEEYNFLKTPTVKEFQRKGSGRGIVEERTIRLILEAGGKETPETLARTEESPQ
jgi:tetratricopeptide (TPR) repeat protein